VRQRQLLPVRMAVDVSFGDVGRVYELLGTDAAQVLAGHGLACPEPYRLAMANSAHGATVLLWFSQDASNEDRVRGVLHALALRRLWERESGPVAASLLGRAHAMAREVPRLRQRLEASGWDLNTVYFASEQAPVARFEPPRQ
jgi:hypothetical protein